MNSLQQHDRFDAFVMEFNTERPHEALAMKCPAEIYAPSPRRYDGLLMRYDLGYFDLEQKTLQPIDNPFGKRLSPMS